MLFFNVFKSRCAALKRPKTYFNPVFEIDCDVRVDKFKNNLAAMGKAISKFSLLLMLHFVFVSSRIRTQSKHTITYNLFFLR